MTGHDDGQSLDRTALILYGSETGNSQDAAEQLGRITERLRFMTNVAEMDSVELSHLKEYTIVLFTISTTGLGDFANNSRKFWKSLLRKRLSSDALSHVSFTTFGFGDSSYVKFNYACLKLHKRLQQLGAHEFYPRGEADEQHEEGSDAAFLPWSLGIKSRLLELYPLAQGQNPIPDEQFLEPKCILKIKGSTMETSALPPASYIAIANMADISEFEDSRAANLSLKEPLAKGETNAVDILLPPEDLLEIPYGITSLVTMNHRMTAEGHWQDVRFLSLIALKNIDYRPGDIVTIYPKNFPEDIDALIKLQNWSEYADKPLEIVANGSNLDSPLFQPNLARLPLPSPCTLRNILLHNLDITAIPRRYFFEQIANFTSDLTHKERLMEFCNPTYTDEFFDYTSRPRRSILEVLQDFPSVQIPFRFATSIFPVLRGRQFSIASCGFAKNTTGHPDPEAVRIDLCVALVKYKTVLKKVRQGVCSRYIASLKVGTDINITFQRGSFPRPIPLLLRPILMIAPGTGIAPMRALVHERLYQKIENQQAVGSATLIFGGRNITTDDLYCKELDSPQSDLTFFVAWSRAQKEKRYVQDIVREQAVLVWDILKEQGGTVFVCGSSGKMPLGVRAAIKDVFASKGRVSEEIAEGWVSELEKQGRYVQETW